jgi:di/tricarboxylate transporter
MSQAGITLIIVGITCVLYVIEKLPVALVTVLGMLASVAVPMAIEYGINPEPVAIACCIGASMAFATPVATTTVTMVQIAGYRFKDYLRVGGLIGLIGVVAAWTVIVLMYGLY